MAFTGIPCACVCCGGIPPIIAAIGLLGSAPCSACPSSTESSAYSIVSSVIFVHMPSSLPFYLSSSRAVLRPMSPALKASITFFVICPPIDAFSDTDTVAIGLKSISKSSGTAPHREMHMIGINLYSAGRRSFSCF